MRFIDRFDLMMSLGRLEPLSIHSRMDEIYRMKIARRLPQDYCLR